MGWVFAAPVDPYGRGGHDILVSLQQLGNVGIDAV